ncbi:hypothetical protein BH23CHL2_BH23CHL2_03520 [soil metagenome]
MDQPTSTEHAASTGLAATSAAWLDLSYESSRSEYEAAVQSVGLEQGWHVLDAGCGSGSFLPALADLVGPTGKLTALDLAPDNIAVVGERLEQHPLACPVETCVGSILDLPFADASFDAVWVAQVLIYLSDEECIQALAELNRVVRPGGLIAAKESTGPLCPYSINPRYWFPVYTHALMNVFRGAPRSPALGRWFERAGLEAIQQRGVLVERPAPVAQVTRRASARLYQFMAEMAEIVDLPPGGPEFWAAQRDPESPESLANHPDLSTGSIHYIVTGRVPARTSNNLSETGQR